MNHFDFKTKRLYLTPFTEGDDHLFHSLNNDTFIRQYLWDGNPIDIDTVRDILHQNQKHFNEDYYGLWKIQLKGHLKDTIGYAGLWLFYNDVQPQLIYALKKAYTKKGFTKEACEAIIAYAFDRLEFKNLVAATDVPNVASQNVALSLGMDFTEKRLCDGKPILFYRLGV